MSGRIPEAYTLLESRFWHRVEKTLKARSEPLSKIEISEWEKENWTYHAKGKLSRVRVHTYLPDSMIGLWYRSRESLPPELTIFGSTNLNSRSANLDTELSFFMATSEPALREQLHEEVDHLRSNAHKVTEKDWQLPERRVRYGTRLLVAAGVEGML